MVVDQKFEIEIHARIRQTEPIGMSSGSLGVQETITVSANGFMELCKILARFHDLAEEIRKGGK